MNINTHKNCSIFVRGESLKPDYDRTEEMLPVSVTVHSMMEDCSIDHWVFINLHDIDRVIESLIRIRKSSDNQLAQPLNNPILPKIKSPSI